MSAAGALPTQPLIAVDVVPVSVTAGELRIATAARRFEPFVGRDALPGVLLGAGEALGEAAHRALATKAGIRAPAVRHLVQIGAFDSTNRDPRQHAIAIAFMAVVGEAVVEEAVVAEAVTGAGVADGVAPTPCWRSATEVAGLAFDHDAIVAEAIAQVRTRLWHDDAFTRALTGPWFTTPDAVRLSEAITGLPTHQSNLRRSLAANPALRSTTAPDTGRPGRRPLVWEWVEPAVGGGVGTGRR